jgi:hypothetical protein
MQNLSPESYPPMLPLLEHPVAWVREGVAAFLGRRMLQLRRETETASWTEAQGSRAWALGVPLASPAPLLRLTFRNLDSGFRLPIPL